MQLTPLERTQQVLDVSATERGTFRTCRRKWELTTLENLTPRVPESLDLELGRGLHFGLEAYYREKAVLPLRPDTKANRRAPLGKALAAFDGWYLETEERFGEAQIPSANRQAILDQLIEVADLGEEILRGYHQYAQGEDRFTVHAVEGKLTPAGDSWLRKHWEEREFLSEHSVSAPVLHESGRILVPILHPTKQTPLKNGACLSMKMDMVVRRIDPGMKGIWIYDHKSKSGRPNDRGLDFDDQITAYCYGYWRLTGIVPRGVCLNYLIKQVPKEPRILKRGSLSTAKDQLTTPEHYRRALIDAGLMLKSGEITSPEHEEAYEALLSRGWEPFFVRHYAARSRQELISFEKRLYDEYWDMVAVYEGNLIPYPNFSPPHMPWCTLCEVAPICQSLEDGSDTRGIIESRFMEAPDRKAIKNGFLA